MIGSCFRDFAVLLIPALPFGLGLRFDQTPSGNALIRSPEIEPTRSEPAIWTRFVLFQGARDPVREKRVD